MNCLFSIQSSAIRSHQNINGLSIRLIFLIFCICMDNEWMMRWWWISCDERNSISGSHRTIKWTSLLAGCPYPLLYLTSSSPSMLLLWFVPRMWMSTCYAKLKCRSTHQLKALSIFHLKSWHSSCKWIWIRQFRWPLRLTPSYSYSRIHLHWGKFPANTKSDKTANCWGIWGWLGATGTMPGLIEIFISSIHSMFY